MLAAFNLTHMRGDYYSIDGTCDIIECHDGHITRLHTRCDTLLKIVEPTVRSHKFTEIMDALGAELLAGPVVQYDKYVQSYVFSRTYKFNDKESTLKYDFEHIWFEDQNKWGCTSRQDFKDFVVANCGTIIARVRAESRGEIKALRKAMRAMDAKLEELHAAVLFMPGGVAAQEARVRFTAAQ